MKAKKKITIETTKDTEKAINADIRLDASVDAIRAAKDELFLAEARIAVPLLHGLLRLKSLSLHSAVLQVSSAGFYVQVQTVVESNSAATSGVNLVWQPITGIYNSPLEAINDALAVPFGRNLTQPPSPLQTDTEGQEGGITPTHQEEGETAKSETEPEEEMPIAFDKSITFSAVSMTPGNLGQKLTFYISGATSDKIYARLKESSSLTIIFDSKTGTAVPNGEYQITEKMLGKVNFAVLAFNSLSKTVDNQKQIDDNTTALTVYKGVTDENSAAIEAEIVQPTKDEQLKETIAEMQALTLEALIGKQVTAEKKYPRPGKDEKITGEYRGHYQNIKDGQLNVEHLVFGLSGGKKKAVVVIPETIKAV